MEKLESKYKTFITSLSALEKTIDVYQKLSHEESDNIRNAIAAGLIQHFEMAFETSWKFLKEFLEIKHGILVASPKTVFQACYKYQILSEALTNELILLLDDRNMTTHVYDEEMAEKMCKSIINHYQVLEKVKRMVKLEKN